MSFLSLIQRPLQDSRDTDLLSRTVRVSPSKYRGGGRTDFFFLLPPPPLLSKFSEKYGIFFLLLVFLVANSVFPWNLFNNHLFSARITRACIFDLLKCLKNPGQIVYCSLAYNVCRVFLHAMIAQPMFIKQRGKSLEKFVNWYRVIIVARIIVGWWNEGVELLIKVSTNLPRK